ncbi:uncharacterized protein LOC143574772 [Bidens hawaiensis]|uniref:uncharacterized protein LOC143574772 n=1 Tax=Bidens hawaiensis TaxID=980011 RepID=UPI00404A7E4B
MKITGGKVAPPNTRGRVFALSATDVANDQGTVSGTLQLGERSIYVLFDTGATHSIVSLSFTKYLLGILPHKTLKIISMLKARKLISHGCAGFLASIKDTSVIQKRIDSHPVVCEYPDVFPEELPGLPHDCEIEFTIDLIPGAEPISKEPYSMAPLELTGTKGAIVRIWIHKTKCLTMGCTGLVRKEDGL